MDYTDDMLEKLQYIIERSIRDNREKYDSLLAGLNNMLSIVNNNRNELKTPVEEEESTPEEKTDEPETFLNSILIRCVCSVRIMD